MSPDGPILAVIGDVHAEYERLEQVLDRIDQVGADGVLLVGDLACCGHVSRRSAETVRRYRGQVAEVLRRVRARGRPFLFVPGNHDLPWLAEPENVDGARRDLAGLRIAGIGGAGPDIFGFAYEWTEEQLRSLPVRRADVLLCHAPPRDTAIDRTAGGEHVGSSAIRDRALSMRGVLVCGHIHEAPGVEVLGDCLCFNVGGLGQPYGRTTVGFLYGLDRLVHEDLESGERREWLRGSPTGASPRA